MVPAYPYDVKGLLKTALHEDNPVMFLEHKGLYGSKGPVPEEEYTIPFGKAVIRREGSDVTIVAVSMMVLRAMEAAEILAKQGISVEVIDPRTVAPLGRTIDSEFRRQDRAPGHYRRSLCELRIRRGNRRSRCREDA